MLGLHRIISVFKTCRRRCQKPIISFEEACATGQVENLIPSEVDLNDGLQISVLKNQIKSVEWFLKNGATNLEECLKLACQNNFSMIAEMLVDKGIDPYKGLRYAKSPLITGMLYAKINSTRFKR